MKLSLKIFVLILASLLLLASVVSLYFALLSEDMAPLLLVALVNIIAVFVLLFLITRGILPSLERIQRTLWRVGEGKLDARVRIDSIPELNQLADTVNETVEKVERSTREVELARARAEKDRNRLKEMERLKTEFVSLAAHQLRMPLSAVKWTLRSLIDEEEGKLSDRQKEVLEKTYGANERMIDLIGDLLNVTRIEEGRYLYEPALAETSELLAPVAALARQEAERKGLTLEVSVPPGLPSVLADTEKLSFALENILDNAVKYTARGGKVSLEAADEGKEVLVTVKDTGIGIPDKEAGRVFEKFFRAENARRVDTEGTGLGLYLVKNIVEAHGGRVAFESSEKGTTFTVALPVARDVALAQNSG